MAERLFENTIVIFDCFIVYYMQFLCGLYIFKIDYPNVAKNILYINNKKSKMPF